MLAVGWFVLTAAAFQPAEPDDDDTLAPASQPASAPVAALRPENIERAAEYAFERGGLALLVQQGGAIVFERYAPGRSADQPHRLASGTKSFWGVLAADLVDDGLLKMDEPVSNTLGDWKADPRKAEITIRGLLSLTSGLDPGDSLMRPGVRDKFAYAAALPPAAEPGRRFRYGPGSFFVFGHWIKTKLNQDPLELLTERIFEPIGLKVARWRRDRAGNPEMAAGAFLTAREWVKFGELVKNRGVWQGERIISERSLRGCFRGSRVNPAYGQTFWTNRPAERDLALLSAEDPAEARRLRRRSGEDGLLRISAAAPDDLIMAAGAGGQRLYIVPSLDLVIVRQAEIRLDGPAGRYIDDDFFRRLLTADSGDASAASQPAQPSSAPASGPQ